MTQITFKSFIIKRTKRGSDVIDQMKEALCAKELRGDYAGQILSRSLFGMNAGKESN